MKNSVVIGVILGFLVTGSQALSAGMAPDWTLLSADGRTTRLSEEVRQQPVVLFFWATWCPYCKALMPHLQSIRLEYGDQVKVLKMNVDNSPQTPGKYGVRSIPTVLAFKGGQVVQQLQGARPKSAFDEMLSSLS